MPRRTADANKAVLAAWEKEQAMVREGKGTRDWTPEQQKDILDPARGKAYDDNGRAFEGQHMKSVEKYPEYQGNPDNIQFLTREEHINAHKGSWQNPTNWYYDPVTKQFFDFGDGDPVPCAVIELSNPVVLIDKCNADEVEDEATQAEEKLISGADPPVKDSLQPMQSESTARNSAMPKMTNQLSNKNGVNKIISRVGKAAKYLWNNYKGEIIAAAFAVGTYVLDTVMSSNSNSEDDTNASPDHITKSSLSADKYLPNSVAEDGCFDSWDNAESVVEDEPAKEKRKSPEEHTVNDRGQRYHYKDGSVRYKEKQPYKRGKPKDEE